MDGRVSHTKVRTWHLGLSDHSCEGFFVSPAFLKSSEQGQIKCGQNFPDDAAFFKLGFPPSYVWVGFNGLLYPSWVIYL